MSYCPRCGTQNTDDSRFCKNCGFSMSGDRRDWDKRAEKECEDTCSGHGRSGNAFWGLVMALIGLRVICTFVLKDIEGLPVWVYDFNFWWAIAIVIGVMPIVIGIRAIIKR